MREWLARLVDWFRRDTLEQELADELHFHQGQLERDALAAGVRPEDARYRARRRLGNVTRVREEARDRWSIASVEHVQQDVRYAIRGLRRSPGFTATVVITLALGIGANVAMFGVVDRLVFRPLALLRDPATVHRVYTQQYDRERLLTNASISYEHYLGLKRWTSSFADIAGLAERPIAVGSGESARERAIAAVTASYFGLFDAQPTIGRFFSAEEDVAPTGASVAVLSHAFWQSAFGGRDVLGEALQVGAVRMTIIGVAPEGLGGANDAISPVLFIPTATLGSVIASDPSRFYGFSRWGWLSVIVRRKTGISVAQASTDVNQAFLRGWDAERVNNPTLPSREVARPRALVSGVREAAGPSPVPEARMSLWVTGVAAVVLLIACANVANLFLARAVRRQRETTLRLALGVSRRRLVSQAITESLVVALIGAAAGFVIAQVGGAAIRALLVPGTPPAAGTFADWRTLVFTCGTAITVGLVTGVAPALLGARGDLAPALRSGGRGGMSPRSAWMRNALLIVQGTLSVTLLVGAALFVRSLAAVKAVPMGYDADRVLIVNRVLRGTALSERAAGTLDRALITTATELPGVEAASWAESVPLWTTWRPAIFVTGIDSVGRLGDFATNAVGVDYFRVAGTRLTRGRALATEDRAGASLVVVLSESAASALWPGKDPLGRCVRIVADTMPCATVVGVAEDVVQNDRQLGVVPRYQLYVSSEQLAPASRNGVLLLRTRRDPGFESEQVRKALQRVMPGDSYVTVRPMRELLDNAQRPWRLGATMFLVFGLLALVVAAVGLYGVIAYDVVQRMHELGVRIALGAQRADILRLVVGRGVRLALVGAALGAATALGASRWLQPLLFQQSATDPKVYAAVTATMLVVALVASVTPALRAAGADPLTALRAD